MIRLGHHLEHSRSHKTTNSGCPRTRDARIPRPGPPSPNASRSTTRARLPPPTA